MLTVLIQNEKTMHSFHQHLPLFHHFLDSNELEVCLWNEEGQTLEEALPDLAHLTDGKKWQAIIVRHEELSRSPYFFNNPYDFCSSQKPLTFQEQMANPLIRLTKWLSKPLEYYDQKSALQEESIERYEGILPESMILLTARQIDSLLSVPSSVHTLYRDFVDRNGYPSYCRFGVIDRQRQGTSARIQSDLEFWSIVLMLAYNRLDSSAMASYHLYSLSCQINLEKMASLWNEKLYDIEIAIGQIGHYLKHQSIYLQKLDGAYPEYVLSADLFRISSLNKEPVMVSSYLSLPSKPLRQASQWHSQNKKLKAKILEQYEQFPEELQERVPILQTRPGYHEEEVRPLGMMQIKRLRKEVEALNLQIIQEQALLPEVHFEKGDELDRCSQEIEGLLATRTSRKQIVKWTLGLCFLSVLSMLFCWLTLLQTKQGLWASLFFSSLLVAMPLLFSWYTIYQEGKRIQKRLETWTKLVDQQYETLQRYKTQYANWLADVLSYRRAQSYLEIALKKAADQEKVQRELETILANLYSFQEQLQVWAKALRLSLSSSSDIDPFVLKQNMTWIDPSVYLNWTKQKELFCFETQSGYLCELLRTGKRIVTPFSFIEVLDIEQFRQRNRNEEVNHEIEKEKVKKELHKVPMIEKANESNELDETKMDMDKANNSTEDLLRGAV